MRPMDRRRFLALTAATATTLRKTYAQAPATQVATLTLHPDKPGPTIPANFVGLSYETQQLSDPDFFSPRNIGLIAQFKALAPHGVLRIGGNTSDVGWWKPTPEGQQPPLPPTVFIAPPEPDTQPFQKLAYAITPQAVINLRGFLDATGWTCLYGINLGTNTPALAAEQASFVAKTLGSKLEYFQLGNEPDLFQRRFRDKTTWTADKYLDEWTAAANAIVAAVPHAKFGLPDTSGSPKWSAAVADRFANDPFRTHIAAISHHHYFGGPPSNPKVNIEELLKPQASVLEVAATTKAAATKLHTLYRMTEGNTCYRGGKPGVSDVFASALWAADYLLLLASLGYAGVNLHGGSGKAVADSLGGTLPGELLMPDPTIPHPRPFYTPIAEIGGKYMAQPISYGMKFAGMFAGATVIPVDFDPGSVNATAYGAKLRDGKQVLAIINKDFSSPIEVRLAKHRWAMLQKLESRALSSREVYFGDFHDEHQCTPKGICTTKGPKIGTSTTDEWLRLTVQPASAIFVELDKEHSSVT